MQNRYCLPIIKSTKVEVLSALGKSLDNYGFFEIWVDYIQDVDKSFIKDLVINYPGKLVFVFRRQNLDEPNLDRGKTSQLIAELSGKDCFIDLDVSSQKSELNQLDKDNFKLIASYHNYDETPSDNELGQIVSEIKSFSPEIIKISTMCGSTADSLRLMGIKRDLLEKNQKHIVLGMGEAGKITRVFGALWGNELIFIPESEEESSAPGQITRAEFDKIMGRVKK